MNTTTRRGDWMQTFTGHQFWPLDPRPEDVDILDVAHALSMLCRYNGHCRRFYSVAEHSVYVARQISFYTPDLARHALWGLLHDASEAYLADIVRPVKRSITGYREAEDAVMHVICDRFGLAHEMPAVVRATDEDILVNEMEQIMAPPPIPWKLHGKRIEGLEIVGWAPVEAEKRFLEMFRSLTSEASK